MADLLHCRFTALHNFFSWFKLAVFYLFLLALLPGQLDFNIQANLLQLYLLHPSLTLDLGHHLGHLVTHLLELDCLHIFAHLSSSLLHLNKTRLVFFQFSHLILDFFAWILVPFVLINPTLF